MGPRLERPLATDRSPAAAAEASCPGWFFSTKRVCCFCSARFQAIAEPITPPPITTTSVVVVVMAHYCSEGTEKKKGKRRNDEKGKGKRKTISVQTFFRPLSFSPLTLFA